MGRKEQGLIGIDFCDGASQGFDRDARALMAAHRHGHPVTGGLRDWTVGLKA
jgi:hypothetical protein